MSNAIITSKLVWPNRHSPETLKYSCRCVCRVEYYCCYCYCSSSFASFLFFLLLLGCQKIVGLFRAVRHLNSNVSASPCACVRVSLLGVFVRVLQHFSGHISLTNMRIIPGIINYLSCRAQGTSPFSCLRPCVCVCVCATLKGQRNA